MKATRSFAAGWGMLAALALTLVWTAPAGAWSTFDAGCQGCHGAWGLGVPLHDLHQSDMLSGDCATCHTSSAGFGTVFLAQSDGGAGLDPISCLGCHGRAEDDAGGLVTGAGLRQHHFNNGFSCAPCHADDQDDSLFLTVGEDILPPYYANPGTGHPNMPYDPCNLDGNEDYTGTPLGLDNDGDLFYDGDDADCVAATPTPTPTATPTPTPTAAPTPTAPPGPTPTAAPTPTAPPQPTPTAAPTPTAPPQPTPTAPPGPTPTAPPGPTPTAPPQPTPTAAPTPTAPPQPTPTAAPTPTAPPQPTPTAAPTPSPGGKVAVCHKGKKTIVVGAPAVKAHLRHGDTLGACSDPSNGRVAMCKTKRGVPANVLVRQSEVSKKLRKGLRLGECGS